MEEVNFWFTIFPLIIITSVIIIAILVLISIFKLDFKAKKHQKITNKVSFLTGI